LNSLKFEINTAWLLSRILGVFLVLICGGICLFSLVFLKNVQTLIGFVIGVFGVILAASPIVFFYLRNSHRLLKTYLFVFFICSLAMLIAVPFLNKSFSNSLTGSRFTKEVKLNPYSLSNIIPEIDQINFALSFLHYLDFKITSNQSQEIRQLVNKVYKEISKDKEFQRLNSSLEWSYRELLGRSFDSGHYYFYIPEKYSDKPLPVLVFLHGSVGNFKAYLWLWSKLAQRVGFVVIAPTFGIGDWQQPGAMDTVRKALVDLKGIVDIDDANIYLAGISNGGEGVSRLALEEGLHFKGLIYISPVMDYNIVDSDLFINSLKKKPILIIAGEKDKRIPIEYIEERVPLWQKRGMDLTLVKYTNEDHFLFFSRTNDILFKIEQWLLRK